MRTFAEAFEAVGATEIATALLALTKDESLLVHASTLMKLVGSRRVSPTDALTLNIALTSVTEAGQNFWRQNSHKGVVVANDACGRFC